MARGVSLTTLITRVRQRSNLEGATAFITDAEITDHLNESIAELYDVIRGVFGQDYFRASTTITTTNSVDTYGLPADFLTLLSVDANLGGNIVVTCRPYMENERNTFKWLPVGWVFNQPVFYRLNAGNITFIPKPTGTYSVTLNYVPTPAKLVNGTDVFDGIAGWEEYAVLDAAIKCLLKDGQLDVAGQLEVRKMAIKARIENLAPERDAGQPERVHDVFGRDAWYGDD